MHTTTTFPTTSPLYTPYPLKLTKHGRRQELPAFERQSTFKLHSFPFILSSFDLPSQPADFPPFLYLHRTDLPRFVILLYHFLIRRTFADLRLCFDPTRSPVPSLHLPSDSSLGPPSLPSRSAPRLLLPSSKSTLTSINTRKPLRPSTGRSTCSFSSSTSRLPLFASPTLPVLPSSSSHHHQTRVQPVADKQVLETGEFSFSFPRTVEDVDEVVLTFLLFSLLRARAQPRSRGHSRARRGDGS